MANNYRLMCDHCGKPYWLYGGYRFFVALDTTLKCCGKPQRLEACESAMYATPWQVVSAEITPRQFYALTEQSAVTAWNDELA